ncbi:MAG: twin-arginine translocase subunit TatC, partial [Actinomycetota bacterium]|nr:twin-arginine translocase subunit TatC [Actinomycetota bacterium]
MRVPRRLGHGEGAELVEHLGELRSRLLISLGAIAVGFGVAYTFHHELLTWLNAPLPDGRQPITLGVAEPFTTSIKVSLYAGFALALPVVLWQVWSFLAPAMSKRTERALGMLVAFATLLFALGVAFGYGLALPAAVHFLTNFDASVYDIQVRASSYYSFSLMVLLSVGLVFELPV